jgi:hypothetical protein
MAVSPYLSGVIKRDARAPTAPRYERSIDILDEAFLNVLLPADKQSKR